MQSLNKAVRMTTAASIQKKEVQKGDKELSNLQSAGSHYPTKSLASKQSKSVHAGPPRGPPHLRRLLPARAERRPDGRPSTARRRAMNSTPSQFLEFHSWPPPCRISLASISHHSMPSAAAAVPQ